VYKTALGCDELHDVTPAASCGYLREETNHGGLMPPLNPRTSLTAFAAILLVAVAAAACADQAATQPTGESPLAGLSAAGRNDTAQAPANPAEPTPGFFRGTVYGYIPGRSDTLETAVRLAGVRVTAYPRVPSSSDPYAVGPAAASVTTDANGEFVLPTLPGGEYAVTFTPPEGSKYRAAWTVGVAHAGSGDRPWWVMLAAKE
jgi:hypothetical protein